MLHRTLSTRNDYDRKINYDWPKCAKATFKRGKLTGTTSGELD